MKKTILVFSVCLVLAVCSCNNSSTNSKNGDSTKPSSVSATGSNTDSIKTDINNSAIDFKKINFNGNEPFWGIKFEEDFATYTSPNELNGVKIFYKKTVGDNANIKLTDAVVKVTDKEFKLLGLMNKSTIAITVKNEKCSDGMSDETHTYSILLTIDKTNYKGCGSVNK